MERTNENKRYNRYGRSWSVEKKFSNPLNRQLMITAKTLAETKPMNNTKKERISNDEKPNRICFFDLLRVIIITAFLFSLYHKIAGRARGCEANHAVRRVYHPQLVAVWNWHEVPYGIITKWCMASIRRRDTRWRVMPCRRKATDSIRRTSRGDYIPILRLG